MEPRDLGGWRGGLFLAGVVVAWYGFFVALGWASVSGATGANHLLEEQPVDKWLLPLAVGSGLVGMAMTSAAWLTSPRHQEGHAVRPWKWFLPVSVVTLALVALLGYSTAVIAAPDSQARSAPFEILPLIGVVTFLAWRRQRKDGGP